MAEVHELLTYMHKKVCFVYKELDTLQKWVNLNCVRNRHMYKHISECHPAPVRLLRSVAGRKERRRGKRRKRRRRRKRKKNMIKSIK